MPHPLRLLSGISLCLLGAIPILAATKAPPKTNATPEPVRVTVAPIKVANDAPLTADFRATHHAWAKRVLLAPRALRGKNEAWEGDARRFLEVAIDNLWENEGGKKAPAWLESGRKLLAAGCHDPLVEFLVARAILGEDGNR